MAISAPTTKTSRSPVSAIATSVLRAACVATLLLAGCASAPADAPPPPLSPAATPAGAGMVDIRALVPDIDVDMRYAGSDNFTGAPVDGYAAPRCYLLRPAAEALQRAELFLRPQGLRLRLFDCYRPARAVRAFMAWVDNPDQHTRARHYPNLDKHDLRGGYIAPVSGHSRGATVDLTLLQCDADRCAPLDMGTDFDFFDTLANTDDPRIDGEQRKNRQRLRAAMEAAGFRNYDMEWWHYTLSPEPEPKRLYDFAIE
jgi:zinc D-Ala-D-Ala dipeptidase